MTKDDILVQVKWLHNFRCMTTNTIIYISYNHVRHLRSYFYELRIIKWRSKWPLGLRRVSATACLLGLRVRIPPLACMYVSCDCCVFSGWPDHSSRGVLPSVACWISVLVISHKGSPWHGIGLKRHKKLNCRGSSEPTDHFDYNFTILKITELNYKWSEC